MNFTCVKLTLSTYEKRCQFELFKYVPLLDFSETALRLEHMHWFRPVFFGIFTFKIELQILYPLYIICKRSEKGSHTDTTCCVVTNDAIGIPSELLETKHHSPLLIRVNLFVPFKDSDGTVLWPVMKFQK